MTVRPAAAASALVEIHVTDTQSGLHVVADRYALRSLLGRGGSGAVWRAHDRWLRRQVAIKQIVLGDQRSTRSRTRAMREAQTVAKLRTPGVVQLYDVHDDGGQIYLVMELIDAPSLSRLVRRGGPLEPERVAQIGRSVLVALLAVHDAGIVHRDVKPSNVLVDNGSVRLTDFGIALLDDDPTLTASGSVLGTPVYMAPEQARGERVGPAADLYGLGATMYFALEGRAPFDDQGSVRTTQAVREQPHRAGRRMGVLEPIIEALLLKDPDARPDAHEVAAALDVTVNGLVMAAPPQAEGAVIDLHGDDATPATTPPPAAPVTALPAGRTVARPAAAGGPSADDERRQLRRALVWGAALLLLLAAAMLLLFVAVREHPEAPATAAALVLGRPTMSLADGDWSTRWSRSTRCARSSSRER